MLAQDGLRLREQFLALGSEGDPARAAGEHGDAEFALQPPDLVSQRGLGDVHRQGGAGEAGRIGDRDESRSCRMLAFMAATV